LSLVTATSLTPSAVWLPMTNAIESTGGMFMTILMARTNHSRFYRLESR
jgi:hypothetical protein